MINSTDILHSFLWPLIFFVVVAFAFAVLWLLFSKGEQNLDIYLKKTSLFDTKSEHELYTMLLKLFGDRFYIFPQVHYSHIVQINKKLSFRERMGYLNSIDRKSADF